MLNNKLLYFLIFFFILFIIYIILDEPFSNIRHGNETYKPIVKKNNIINTKKKSKKSNIVTNFTNLFRRNPGTHKYITVTNKVKTKPNQKPNQKPKQNQKQNKA
jgi:hypothetical protein